MPEKILHTEDRIPSQRWEMPTEKGARLKAVVEAARLFNQGTSGRNRWKQVELIEAMATADFNILLGQAFEVELLATYEDITPEWQSLFFRTTVKDFKPKKLIEIYGGRDPFDKVGEGEEYRDRDKDEDEFEIFAEKFGNTFSLTWELLKNDELDGLKTLPQDLAQGAISTEDFVAFSAIATESGPNPAYFRAPEAGEKRPDNAIDNKPLTRENLEAAYIDITRRRGKDNRPIRLSGQRLKLVVPQALQFQAEAIVNTPVIEVTEGTKKYTVPNPLAGKFDVVVSYWVSLINTSAKSDTTWYITGSPTLARPPLAVAFMRGEENPDIRVKADTGNRVGGGSINPEAGSFDDDTIKYRGRHVVGSAGVDPITTYASTGS